MQLRKLFLPVCLIVFSTLSLDCKKSSDATTTSATGTTSTKTYTLTLDWKPEPEFGGFYAAQKDGAFTKQNLAVDLKPVGEGLTPWQLVDRGQTDFATTAADQVLIARSGGADVVAIFAAFQKSPQGVMTHGDRKFKSLEEVFHTAGTLAAEQDTWLTFCQKKFAPVKVTQVAYSGGIAPFIAKADYSQQCFVTSEPLQAKAAGLHPKSFLVADSGYNPYTTVVICRGSLAREHPEIVKAMAAACRAGWENYLKDPKPANEVMAGLNTAMTPATFAEAAELQKSLIETEKLGSMTTGRWDELSKQLVDLGVLKTAVPAGDCFVNPE